MAFRREKIYVSTDILRALILLAKRANKSRGHSDEDPKGFATADDIADILLRDAIRDKYPIILDYQKKVDLLEKELIETSENSDD
jgi:hypothetical protein